MSNPSFPGRHAATVNQVTDDATLIFVLPSQERDGWAVLVGRICCAELRRKMLQTLYRSSSHGSPWS
jgi:hypothetical protein